MDLNFNKKEKKLLKIADEFVDKWRKILNLDPLWELDISVFDDEMMPGALARVDVSGAEYFMATIELSYDMLDMKEDEFKEKINEVICHELLHVVSIDYYRTAQLSAGENDAIQKELRYRYEQFTSRLQKTFTDLGKFQDKSLELEEKIEEIKNILNSDDQDKIDILKKYLGIQVDEKIEQDKGR